MTAQESCGNCYHWLCADNPQNPIAGYCRAAPPKVFRIESNHFDSAFPPIHALGWCGKWHPSSPNPSWRDTEPPAPTATSDTVVPLNRKARRAQKAGK